MATAEEILSHYDDRKELYRDFCERVSALLRNLTMEAGMNLHSLTSRLKDRESLRLKIQKRETNHYDSLASITDIAGIRITTYYADEVDRVAELIQQEFNVDSTKSINKRTTLDPDRFGYLSFHFIVSLSQERQKLAEYSRFSGLQLEIQVRSILQHAWAEIEHDLGYKSARAIPQEVRRQFARLAGLLELADEQFTAIKRTIHEYQQEVAKLIITNPKDVILDKDSLIQYVNYSSLLKDLDEQLAATLQSTLFMNEEHLSSYLENLAFIGIEEIGQLNEALEVNERAILALADYFQAQGEEEEEELEDAWIMNGISIFYLCYIILAKKEDQSLFETYLEEFSAGTENPAQFARELISWYITEFSS